MVLGINAIMLPHSWIPSAIVRPDDIRYFTETIQQPGFLKRDKKCTASGFFWKVGGPRFIPVLINDVIFKMNLILFPFVRIDGVAF